MHHQEGVAVHFLVVIGTHVDLETELAHGGIDVHGHGFGGRPGHARLGAGLTAAAALLAETARVHEEQEGAFETGQEHRAFQLHQVGIDLGRPSMAVLRFFHFAFEVQNDGVAVLPEETFAFGHRRGVGRAGAAAAVFTAAEHTLHTDPLGHDDALGIDPLVVGVSLGLEGSVDALSLFRA